MSNNQRVILLTTIFIICVLTVSVAEASYISMSTQTTTQVNDSRLLIDLIATNRGDEPAHNVQFEIKLGNEKYASEINRVLGINAKYEFSKEIILKDFNKGSYPLIITTNYQDANGYQFSAISTALFSLQAPTVSEISIMTKNLEMSDKGKLAIRVKNSGSDDKDITLFLAAPKEISVEKPKINLIIKANEEKTINFDIGSFSALSGSNYNVAVIAEYEEDNSHYSVASSGIVKIVDKKKLFFLSYSVLIWIVVLLVIAFVIAQFIGKNKEACDDNKKN